MKRILMATAMVLGFAGQAGAAQMDGCNLEADAFDLLIAPMLDGAWTVHNGAGIMAMKIGAQEMMMPMPQAGSEVMAFLYKDGKVVADMAFMGEADVSLATDEKALVEVDGVQMGMDVTKLGGDPECAAEDLLRIEFAGNSERVEAGGNLWAQFDLYVVDENRLSGTLIIQGTDDGAEVHTRRLVTLIRN